MALAYRSLTPRTVAAAAGAAVGLAAVFVDTLVPGSPLDVVKDPQAPLGDLVNAWLFVVASVLELATMLLWIYAGARNLVALRREALRYTPFTSVAWFFMPIANLWMGYRVLAEIWRASDPEARDPAAWVETKAPLKLLAWWLITLCGVLGDDGPTAAGFVGVAVNAVSAGMFVLLAFELRDRQDALAARLSRSFSE